MLITTCQRGFPLGGISRTRFFEIFESTPYVAQCTKGLDAGSTFRERKTALVLYKGESQSEVGGKYKQRHNGVDQGETSPSDKEGDAVMVLLPQEKLHTRKIYTTGKAG